MSEFKDFESKGLGIIQSCILNPTTVISINLLRKYIPSIINKNKPLTEYMSYNALMLCCAKNKIESFEIIVATTKHVPLDFNAVDKFGRTALHYACQSGSIELVERLLDTGQC